ncbi:uncharacterized protein L201_004057 [Kwoniella dendrophila CBS 6074]|uniref:Uncharacterized protein n=1 Tax=Kwoniella dendrophila CBS 6074 TaxID=1295534 RepID=A0AAX4JWH7_9TREE
MAPRIPFFNRSRQSRGQGDVQQYEQPQGHYDNQAPPPQPGLLSYMPPVGDEGEDSPPSGDYVSPYESNT